MTTRTIVDDPADPRLTVFTGLRDEQLRRRRESPGGDAAGVFICEGAMVTTRALAAGHSLKSILVADDMTDHLPPLPTGARVYQVPPVTAEAITGYRFHRGFVAAFDRPRPPPAAQVLSRARRVVVTENVTDSTNMGVVIRSAAALGIDAVIVDEHSCDPLYRRVIRVSMGTVFTIPHLRVGELPSALGALADREFQLVGLSPDEKARPIRDFIPTGRVALVIGAEGPGLSQSTRLSLDELVRIPMRPGVDSLNVGAAVAIGAYVVGGLEG